MFNPYTGKSFENLVFIGPIYYQRLRHLVDDKMYSRSRGVVVALTRQPTHGRRRSGGLRFGEMERDCVISHGMSELLKERLFTVSDRFRIHVCSQCGLMAVVNPTLGRIFCKTCQNAVKYVLYRTFLSFKLRSHTLLSFLYRSSRPCTSFQGFISSSKRTNYDLITHIKLTIFFFFLCIS